MPAQDRMPVAYRALTEQERAFVSHYAIHADVEGAKKAARYLDTAGGHYLLRRPDVVTALRFEIQRLMATEGASVAYGSLRRIAKDQKAPAAAQVAAAKALLQGAGLLEAPQASGNAKSINDMTRDELREYIEAKRQEIDQVERQLADAAQDVTPNPNTQAPDIFE